MWNNYAKRKLIYISLDLVIDWASNVGIKWLLDKLNN